MIRKRLPVLAAGLSLFAAVAAAASPPITAPPLGTRWFAIRMNGERTGFARTGLEREGEGYRLTGESGAKMVVMGFSRESAGKESYHLDGQLALVSGSAEEILDGKRMLISIRAEPKGLAVATETAGTRKERLLKAKGPVYPMWTANLYPLLRGFIAGKKYVMQAFDPEGPEIKKVKITAVGIEKGKDGVELFHLRNDLYPFVDNDIWVDREGNTIRESVRDGLVVTEAEAPEQGALSLAAAAVSRQEMALQFSLIPSPEPIPSPERVTKLVLTFAGFPADFPLLSSPRQETSRREDGSVKVTVVPARREPAPGAPESRYLAATERIPAADPEIAVAAKEAVGGAKEPAERIEKLARWVAGKVEVTDAGSRSTPEALKSGKGNSPDHARLYLALARSLGIPSRMISGLVWVPEKGFFYHSWAESFADGAWTAVDPSLGQVPADATHIKLVEGEELAPLARVIGRLRLLQSRQEPAGEPPKK